MTCDWFVWRYLEIVEGSCVCVRARDMYLEFRAGSENFQGLIEYHSSLTEKCLSLFWFPHSNPHLNAV